jgi:hypothetical protein
MKEDWHAPPPPKSSADPGLFIECGIAQFPIKIPSDGRIHALNLFPAPLANGGGGIAEYSGQPGSDFTLLPVIRWVYRCAITNYGTRTLVNIVLGPHLMFQSAIRQPDNPNARQSGPITAQRPWRIDINKIDPGAAKRAVALIGQTIQQQSSLLSYLDVFFVFAIFTALMVPFALLLKSVKVGGGPDAR